jgi:hypothetical protein
MNTPYKSQSTRLIITRTTKYNHMSTVLFSPIVRCAYSLLHEEFSRSNKDFFYIESLLANTSDLILVVEIPLTLPIVDLLAMLRQNLGVIKTPCVYIHFPQIVPPHEGKFLLDFCEEQNILGKYNFSLVVEQKLGE